MVIASAAQASGGTCCSSAEKYPGAQNDVTHRTTPAALGGKKTRYSTPFAPAMKGTRPRAIGTKRASEQAHDLVQREVASGRETTGDQQQGAARAERA